MSNGKNSKLFRLSVLAGAILSGSAYAGGFGEIVLHSALGENLRAEVPVLIAEGEAVSDSCFLLGVPPGSDLPVVSDAQVRLLRGKGGARLLITGRKPVAQPIFMISLRAHCGIDLQRDYVLMPDAPFAVINVPVDAELGGAPSQSARAGVWRTNEGETLAAIAGSLSSGAGLAQQKRTLAALHRANPGLAADEPLPDGMEIRVPDLKRRAPAGEPVAREKVAKKSTPPVRAAYPVSARKELPPPGPVGDGGVRDRVVVGTAQENLRLHEQAVPPQGSISDMDARMQTLETRLQQLHGEVEKLNAALLAANDALAAAQKLQAAQGALPSAVAGPVVAGAQPASSGKWLEHLLSALAGGAVAVGLAITLSRRRQQRAEAELPLAFSGGRSEVQVVADSTQPPDDLIDLDLAAPASLPGVSVFRDSVLGAGGAPSEESKGEESVFELIEIMLSYGRVRGAAEMLGAYIDETQPEDSYSWNRALELYRQADMREEFEALLPRVREKFNTEPPPWAGSVVSSAEISSG